MTQRPALGRGLGSLFSQAPTLTEQVIPTAKGQLLEIALEKIVENPRQPRRHFSPAQLEDLIGSIKEHGILQPLVVTVLDDGYELIAGERRFRASKALGLKTVPAIVREANEQEKLELALIENIQRQQLNAVEEALAYKALIDEFSLTQQQVAERVGKQRSTVANIVRLLDLDESMLEAIVDGRLTKSHARTLLAEADPDRRQQLFEQMLRGDVSVREAEARVGATSTRRRKGPEEVDPNILAHEKTLRERLGTKVKIRERAGRGTITIDFYSREELMELLDRFED